MRAGKAVLLLAALLLFPVAAAAQEAAPSPADRDAVIRYSQAAIGRALEDYALLNPAREIRHLADFRGKPLVVNMVYTGCTFSCPITVRALKDAVTAAEEVLGRGRFNVVTVGFDTPHDTPERMGAYAAELKIKDSNWEFLSGDAETVTRLARNLGFVLTPSAGGFEHVAQTTVVAADGRIYQHVYGAGFEPPALVEPLKSLLILGPAAPAASVSLFERIRLFCTNYDSATGRYNLNYGVFIGLIIGALSLLAVFALLLRAALRAFRRPHASGGLL